MEPVWNNSVAFSQALFLNIYFVARASNSVDLLIYLLYNVARKAAGMLHNSPRG